MAETEKRAHTKLSGAFELLTKSKDLVMKNGRLFGLLYALPLLLTIADMGSGSSMNEDRVFAPGGSLLGFGISLTLVILVASVIVQVMILVASLKVADGKQPGLDEVWNSSKSYILRLVGLGIVVGLLFVGGLILFIVPGLIVLRRYFLAPYYLIDKDLSITEAMKQSAAESKPVSGSVWSLIGVYILLSMATILPTFGGIISLILTALYSAAPALRYREIRALSHAKD
jgi:uncharacterized membrane protein